MAWGWDDNTNTNKWTDDTASYDGSGRQLWGATPPMRGTGGGDGSASTPASSTSDWTFNRNNGLDPWGTSTNTGVGDANLDPPATVSGDRGGASVFRGGGNPSMGGGTGAIPTNPSGATFDPSLFTRGNDPATFGRPQGPPLRMWGGNVISQPTSGRPSPGGGYFPAPDAAPTGTTPAATNTPAAAPTGPPALSGNSTYWNPYTQQWQATYPNTPMAGFGSIANTAGPGGTNFAPSYLTGQNVTGPGANGTGQNTSSQQINPQYYASEDSAKQFAQMLGGTAFMNTNGNAPDGSAAGGSPFNFANAWMVRLPDGRVINAGQEMAPWSNGSANSDTIGNILRGGATLQQQQAMMPLSPSVNPGNYQGGSGMPLTLTDAARQQYITQHPQQAPVGQPQPANPSGDMQQMLMQLFQQYQQPAPFSFGSLVQQLYGGNPFNAAFGNYGGQAAQSAGNSGSSMSDIASILNSLFASRQAPSNSSLSPLFWGSGLGTPQSSYYPTFR